MPHLESPASVPGKEMRRTMANKNKLLHKAKKNEDGTKWEKGEKVNVISRNGKQYLRTDKNEIEEDNLGNLPEYNC